MEEYVQDYQKRAAQALEADEAFVLKRKELMWNHLKDENGNLMSLEEVDKLLLTLVDKPLHEAARPVARDNMVMFYALNKGMTPDEVIQAIDREDPRIIDCAQEYLDILKRQDSQEIIGLLDDMQKTMLAMPKEEYLHLNDPDYLIENLPKVRLLGQYSIAMRQNFYGSADVVEEQWSKQAGVKNYLDDRARASNLAMIAHIGADMVTNIRDLDRDDMFKTMLIGNRYILDQSIAELSSMDGYSDFLHSERMLEKRSSTPAATPIPKLTESQWNSIIDYALRDGPNEMITVLPDSINFHPKSQHRQWEQHSQNNAVQFYKNPAPDRVTLTVHDHNIHPNEFISQIHKTPGFFEDRYSKSGNILKEMYGETFSVLTDSPLMSTFTEHGFSEFDMIFIDGKSATELYGGKTPNSLSTWDQERIKKQIAFAALQGDKHIDICRPEIDNDGTLKFSKPIAADMNIKAPERRPTVKERFKHFFRIERIPESRAKAAQKLSSQDKKGEDCQKRQAGIAAQADRTLIAKPLSLAQANTQEFIVNAEKAAFSQLRDPEAKTPNTRPDIEAVNAKDLIREAGQNQKKAPSQNKTETTKQPEHPRSGKDSKDNGGRGR